MNQNLNQYNDPKKHTDRYASNFDLGNLTSSDPDASGQSALHQPIDVDAAFMNPHLHNRPSPTGSKVIPAGLPCLPRAFRLGSGREVTITEIGLIHPKFNGIKTLFVFDVTDGSSDYRLSFNTENLQWFLEWEGDQYV